MTSARPRPRSAFSLIEAAIVLGIVGLVIGGIWAAASAVSFNRKIARTSEQVLEMVEKVRSKFKQQPLAGNISFHGTTTSATYIGQSGWSAFMPADMISAAIDPVNPFGMASSVTLNEGPPPVLFISITVPDAKTCARLGPLLNSALKGNLLYGNVRTANFDYDISTSQVAGSSCQQEYVENDDSVAVGLYIKL